MNSKMNVSNVNIRSNSRFRAAIYEFRNRKAIVVSGMLLALHLVLSVFISLPLTSSVRISIAFITNVVTGYLYGPWMAMITGALGDILQLILRPTGGYFFGWTFNAALGGFLYGLMFYQKAPKEKKSQEEGKKISHFADTIPTVVFVLILVAWQFLPFLQIMEPKVSLKNFSAIFYLNNTIVSNMKGNPEILIIAAFVMAAAGIVFSLYRRRILTIMLSTAACLWLLLPVYTNRDIWKPEIGFYFIVAGFFVNIIINLVFVLKQNSMDARFLLRCFITMTVVAVIIQMFLGTVWCVIMYGKGFWFYFTTRAIKSLIQLPFNTVLVYYIIRMMKQHQMDIVR